MKRRIALWVFATTATAIAALFLFRHEQTGLVLAVVWGQLNANRHPPQIVAGHLSNDDWRNRTGASRKFTAVLQQRFPEGTDESLLKSELLGEGFKLLSSIGRTQCQPPIQIERIGWASVTCTYPANVFEYHWAVGLICSDSLFVSWSTGDHGKTARIAGEYNSTCL